MLKAKWLLCVFCALALLFVFVGCNNSAEVENSKVNEETETVLYLGVNEKSFVEFDFLDEDCVLNFDAEVLELKDKTLFAKNVGTTDVIITSPNLNKPIIKTVVVKNPEFCGNVWFNSVYTYCLVGHPKAIIPNNLNKDYSFDIKLYSKSPHFKIDEKGNIVPLSVGRGALILSLASGVSESGELIYTNFSTAINVVPASMAEVFVIDENGVSVEERNGKHVFHPLPSGTQYGFKFVCDEGFFVANCEVNVISQNNFSGKDNLINLYDDVKNDLQKFVLFDDGNVSFSLSLTVCCYNYSSVIKTNTLNFEVFQKTTNITAKVSSVEFGNRIEGDNEFNVYAINELFKNEAKEDKIYSSVFVKFESNSKTDVLDVSIVDEQGNVFPKGEGYVVRANKNGVVKFVVSSKSNNYKEEFVFNVLSCFAEGANFPELNVDKNIFVIGEIVDVKPVLNPSYALANVSYVYDDSIFEIKEGKLFAKEVGNSTLKTIVNNKEYVHSIKIINANVNIFSTIQYNYAPFYSIISYVVGVNNLEEDLNNYLQEVEVFVYDKNKNILQNTENVLISKQPNKITLWLNENYGCYVQLYSEEYEAYSDLFWIQSY